MEDGTIVQFPDGATIEDQTPKRRGPRSRQELVALRRELWDLRLQGKTYIQIAEELGIPHRTVVYNCQAAVREIDATQMLEEEMAVSLAQLNEIQRLTWNGFADGNTDDRDAWYKAHDRKMKLLGLEAPKRVDIFAEIRMWAEREGLDPQDVIEATATLLPVPKPPANIT